MISTKLNHETYEATGDTIAITYSDEDGGHAKLIAQAPTLASRLQQLIDAVEGVEDAWGCGDLAGAVRELVGVAEDAREVLRDAGVLV